MSDDMYPRVIDSRYGGWRPMDEGNYKVVPADAIVIERGDLPEVTSAGSYLTVDGVVYGTFKDAAEAELISRRWLALTEYLRTHPPVDEAEVQRLRDMLLDADESLTGTQVENTAHRLYIAGVRAPEVTE